MNAKKPATITVTPFIPFGRTPGRPFYRQIYDGCRAAILSGRLQPGQRLQSTRALAVELKISRLPVINAYEQLLHEGYIEGKAGAGEVKSESRITI
jgi:GntR family transcriptional regulator / MocR family aminotransferase